MGRNASLYQCLVIPAKAGIQPWGGTPFSTVDRQRTDYRLTAPAVRAAGFTAASAGTGPTMAW